MSDAADASVQAAMQAPSEAIDDPVMPYELGSPTFSAIYQEVMVANGCNSGSFCHGGPTGGLTTNEKQATYDALVGVSAMGMTLWTDSDAGAPDHCIDSGLVRVVPGDPDNSLLMMKLLDEQPCGTQMPPGELLKPEQIEQIRTWIENGAEYD